MGAELLHNSLQYNLKSSLWDISLISVFCMCCIVFLGLKLKWFRAQLRFGESSDRKDNAPVQGVGFKLKTNPDDFQVYRITSEFAPISNQNPLKMKDGIRPMIQTHQKQNSHLKQTTSNVNIHSNIIKIQQNSSSTNVATINKTYYSKPSDDKYIQNVELNSDYVTMVSKPANAPTENVSKPHETISNQPTAENHPSKARPIIKKHLEKPKTVNFEPQPVEITNPNAQKYSDITRKTKINERDDESLYPNATVSKNHAIRNPLAAQRFTTPVENEEYKIKIVNETPNKQAKQEYDDGYFMANNYSNAASIFFGGNAPVAQPRPRKFVEMDEDNISNSSETCA